MSTIALNSHHPQLDTLKKELLQDGELVIKPYSYFKDVDPQALRLFMHYQAFYTLPTLELIEFLHHEINGFKAIEICCGSGSIGKALNIPATDLKLQERPDVKMYYKNMGQPLIKYPKHVKEYEAVKAVKKSMAKVVIGSYITHKHDGIDGSIYAPNEKKILKMVKKYIHIGDLQTHKKKPLMKMDYKLIQPQWLIVRGKYGYIGIWENK